MAELGSAAQSTCAWGDDILHADDGGAQPWLFGPHVGGPPDEAALDKCNPREPAYAAGTWRSCGRGGGYGRPSFGDCAFKAASARLLWRIPRRVEWDGRMAWRAV